MKLAMQFISNARTVRSKTVHDLKDFDSQTLETQAKKGKQLVFMMPAVNKAFGLMGDDIVPLSTENESLQNKIGSYDEKWLEESKTKLLKIINDETRAKLIMSRMEKQMKKQEINKWLIYVMINYGEITFITKLDQKIESKI